MSSKMLRVMDSKQARDQSAFPEALMPRLLREALLAGIKSLRLQQLRPGCRFADVDLRMQTHL